MTRKLRNRLDMLHRTLAHFDGATAAWSDHEPLTRNVEKLRDATAEMDRAALVQAGGDTRGLTEAKRAARTHAAGLLHVLGRKVGAYALEAGDADLRRAVDRSRSEWDDLPDEAFGPEAVEEAYSAAVPTLEVLDRLVPALVEDPVFVATYAEVRQIEGD
jgi:hypothetical protein